MIIFSESGHPVSRGFSALDRGGLRSKGVGKLSIHFCGDDGTAEVVLRTIISVNQLSVNGAVADICDELALRISLKTIPKLRLFHQNCRQRTTRFGLMRTCKETCCKITSNKSHIFHHIIFN